MVTPMRWWRSTNHAEINLIMSDIPGPLTAAVRDSARRSVLCWLATVDAQGQPNVSPKEVWAIVDDCHVVVANIASPVTARNIAQQAQVCLSFVDVFVQKGFKLVGMARVVRPDAVDFAVWAEPLLAMTGERFPTHNVWVIAVQSSSPIVAPSYWMHPDTSTEAAQISSAMRAYGVTALPSS